MANVWRAERVGVRLAPSGTYNGMADSHPRALFHHVVESLNRFGLAYLHLIEPRVKGGETIAEAEAPVAAQELSKVYGGPVIAAGGIQSGDRRAKPCQGRCGFDRVRPPLHRKPGFAEADRARSSAQSV